MGEQNGTPQSEPNFIFGKSRQFRNGFCKIFDFQANYMESYLREHCISNAYAYVDISLSLHPSDRSNTCWPPWSQKKVQVGLPKESSEYHFRRALTQQRTPNGSLKPYNLNLQVPPRGTRPFWQVHGQKEADNA